MRRVLLASAIPLPLRWLAIAVISACGVAGCAKDKQRYHPVGERKWYESSMSSEDRAFFLDSFFDGGGR